MNIAYSKGVRYQEGRLVDVALSALDQSNIRALKLDESSPSFRKLKSFFKNVFIGFSHLKNRRKKIQNLIPAAGFHEFQKEPGMEMTVQVCSLRYHPTQCFYILRSYGMFCYDSNTTVTHTTFIYSIQRSSGSS